MEYVVDINDESIALSDALTEYFGAVGNDPSNIPLDTKDSTCFSHVPFENETGEGFREIISWFTTITSQDSMERNKTNPPSTPFAKYRIELHSGEVKLFDHGKLCVREKVGRNDPCPCGSGKKYKKCCGQ